ncbi:MAG: S8 family serine peptidase [Candidatus Sericytochromatia bacterium]
MEQKLKYRLAQLRLFMRVGLLGLLLTACQSPLPANVPTRAVSLFWLNEPPLQTEILLRLNSAPSSEWGPLQLLNAELKLYSQALPNPLATQAQLSKLRQDPRVIYAEMNQSYALEQSASEQLTDTAEGFQISQVDPSSLPPLAEMWNLKQAKIPEAWKLVDKPTPLTVAVIDSGVDPDHPLLKSQLLPLEDIWNEVVGKDILRSKSDSNFEENYVGRDGNGHGTHIAGIVHMIANQAQAGGPVKILPIKATNMAGATNALVLTQAFQRALEKGAKVINLSIGTVNERNPPGSKALQDIIQLVLSKGIVVIGATGNESQRSLNTVAQISAPAFYEGLIAVGAVNDKNNVADYSNGGPEIELVAPGGGGARRNAGKQILSSWPTYRTFESYQGRIRTLGQASTSGTSMAAPHVTGTVALLLAKEPQLTPSQVRARLMVTADDLKGNREQTSGFDQSTGWGQLNAFQALGWNLHNSGK